MDAESPSSTCEAGFMDLNIGIYMTSFWISSMAHRFRMLFLDLSSEQLPFSSADHLVQL